MTLTTIVVILLILLLLGALPVYPYSRDWGYSPVGLIILILILVVIFRGGLG